MKFGKWVVYENSSSKLESPLNKLSDIPTLLTGLNAFLPAFVRFLGRCGWKAVQDGCAESCEFHEKRSNTFVLHVKAQLWLCPYLRYFKCGARCRWGLHSSGTLLVGSFLQTFPNSLSAPYSRLKQSVYSIFSTDSDKIPKKNIFDKNMSCRVTVPIFVQMGAVWADLYLGASTNILSIFVDQLQWNYWWHVWT